MGLTPARPSSWSIVSNQPVRMKGRTPRRLLYCSADTVRETRRRVRAVPDALPGSDGTQRARREVTSPPAPPLAPCAKADVANAVLCLCHKLWGLIVPRYGEVIYHLTRG